MEENKRIPTATDFLEAVEEIWMPTILVEYARLHCKAQAEEIVSFLIDSGEEELADMILNIYPLENIKSY